MKMSNINTTWFYIIDERFWNEIHIENNLYVSLFFENQNDDILLFIGENSTVDCYSFFYEKSPKNIIIQQNNQNSTLNFKALFMGYTHDLFSNIESVITSNNCKANLHIVSIIKEKKIWIHSSIYIEKNTKNIQSQLDLENICIWNQWSIHSLPSLFVHSNDVKVSHSSKTHRIDEAKIFYLQSRWLTKKESISLLLKSYFIKNFACIEMMDKNLFKKIISYSDE
jgi:hypothetical protein